MVGGSNNDSEIKKGPWTAEEDEILLKFVNKYGPRDWSSIRSKGLLPRTGKSCRLRWVNKLRPNLKVGCKFTAEEERMVVDMQARFGNKWATIATYLPGRTDNDVKNFWSTRQKRLARILQSSSSSEQHKPPLKSKGKVPLVHHQASASPLQVSMVGGGDCNQVKEEASSSYSNQQPQSSSLPYLQNNEIIMAAINPQPLVINDPSTQELLFTQLPQHPKLDHSFLLENQDLVTGFIGEPSGSGLDFFPHQNACGHLENVAPFCYGSPAFGFDSGGGGSQGGGGSSGGRVGQGDIGNFADPEILFDDFPAIVFDSLEPFPSSPEH